MAFKTLFLAHAPDADPGKHRSVVDTGRLRLFIVAVKSQAEALEVSRLFYEKEKIEGIILCPGFSHGDAGEIFQALEGKVSVNVARGDGPSNRITAPIIMREYYDATNPV